MILQRLVEYYDRIASDPVSAANLPKPGYSLQKVSFCTVLEPDGRLQQFQSLLDAGVKRAVPRQLLVPGQTKPAGSGINPGFLWDNAAYMLGFKPDDLKPERTRQSFEAFREKHLAIEKEINCAALGAVCSFLREWSPERSAEHADVLRGITGSFGVFRIAGHQRFVHDESAVVNWWLSQNAPDDQESVTGLCLVTGKEERIARLHEPKIKGVRDAQSAGALLVSFNDQAYESFGKTQSYNAPVGATAAFKYTNALNHLLARQERRVLLGDATVVFWAERPTPLEDFISDLFSDSSPLAADEPAEDKRRAEQVRLFLSQLRQGYAAGSPTASDGNTRFYVLGLSPNASRISVRFWADTSVAEMEAKLRQHLEDVELVGAREDDKPLTISALVRATGRAKTDPKGWLKYDAKSVSPLLAGAVARAVLTGGPYPQPLLTAMIRRVRSDGVIGHPRIAAIKACLVRNSRLKGNPKEVTVALDIGRTETAYVTGRLFALLEKIQEDSVEGNLNATIKDRYFSSASATPGVVFPRLIRLSQHHLAKLEGGLKVHREKQLGEVMNKLSCFPSHLNLEDQGLFAVGYFHQRQDFFTKKDNKPKEEDPA